MPLPALPNTMNHTSASSPWGVYAPTGFRKALLTLIRTGISHGPVKRIIQRAWLAWSAPLPVDIEYFGAKLRLHPWNNVAERKILFGSKRRDGPEIEFLAGHLDRDSVFFDIGANIGYYSCMVAAAGVRRIVAVEPHPVTRERLRFNIETNHFDEAITIAPYALGNAVGEVTLTTHGGDLGSSSVVGSGAGKDVTCHTVEMITLVELCAKLSIERIDAAKIDIEGLEDKVLIPFFETAPHALWPRYLIMEHAHSQEWGGDLFSKISQCGYRPSIRTRANTIYSL